jgi:ubiquinone/menaquinone biosynthesis C-methylase UbiE
MDLSDSENMLYINAGTGGHALSIHEKFGDTTNIFAICEDKECLAIAVDKAAAVAADIDFSTMRFEDDSFDAVLADATFVPPSDLGHFVDEVVRIARNGADLAIVLPTAGSFGEIFSILWEVFYLEDPESMGAKAEKLIAELPTTGEVEEIAHRAGFVNINTQVATEIFDFENGADFIGSPLMDGFLLSGWLPSLDDIEKERFTEKISEIIDSEGGATPFIFTVKATLLTGEKA